MGQQGSQIEPGARLITRTSILKLSGTRCPGSRKNEKWPITSLARRSAARPGRQNDNSSGSPRVPVILGCPSARQPKPQRLVSEKSGAGLFHLCQTGQMDHDLYKPLFLIRLEDLDPQRHVLTVDCIWCGLKREINFQRYMEENGDHLIRWFGTLIPCPNPACGKKPENYGVEMKPGVRMRTLKEVDPSR